MKILNRESLLNNSIEVQKTQKRRSREYINIRRKKGKFSRGVWYMFSNNNFQFLNNITHISTHYFHPHIYPNMFLNNNFQVLSACTKHLRNVTIVLQVVLPTFNIQLPTFYRTILPTQITHTKFTLLIFHLSIKHTKSKPKIQMEELAFKLQPTTTVQPNLNHHTASLQPCSTLSNPNQTQHIINPQNKTKQRKTQKKN